MKRLTIIGIVTVSFGIVLPFALYQILSLLQMFDQQFYNQFMSQILYYSGTIISVGIIILIISAIRRTKNWKRKVEKISNQNQEKELKILREKVTTLENNNQKRKENVPNQNQTESTSDSELSIEELERKIREENNEN